MTIALAALLLACVVIVLGAYVRLADAGLGCPDWPGCYGHVDVPQSDDAIAVANAAYPERPVEVAKAWKEMVHRYFASGLGLLIVVLAVAAWRRRRIKYQQLRLPFLLLALVIFQGILGMWTVTWQLKPVVVTAHLLGGFATLALLWWLVLRQGGWWARKTPQYNWLRPWALLALIVVTAQVALGGWTSANYAALACPDFPTCQASWWPAMDIKEGFVLWRGLGVSYEYGVLESEARVAIHMFHRLGAVVVLLYIIWLAINAMRSTANRPLRICGAVLAGVLLAQIGLGIANVVFYLPLPVAVAHNGGAALLILALVALNHVLRPAMNQPIEA